MVHQDITNVEAMLRGIDPGITEEELRAVAAKAHPMTPEDRREQRISFIMGTISSRSTMTREEVAQYLEDHRW